MNRLDFFKRSILFSASAGSLLLLGNTANRVAATPSQISEARPCDDRIAFAKTYVKRLMDVLDSELDQPTKIKLMELNGKACHRGHLEQTGKTESPKLTIEQLIENINKWGYATRTGNTVFVDLKNGSDTKPGTCLCPITEDGPEGLSPTYCCCSQGYMRDMFDWSLNTQVKKVEAVETVRRGGNTCSFNIEV